MHRLITNSHFVACDASQDIFESACALR